MRKEGRHSERFGSIGCKTHVDVGDSRVHRGLSCSISRSLLEYRPLLHLTSCLMYLVLPSRVAVCLCCSCSIACSEEACTLKRPLIVQHRLRISMKVSMPLLAASRPCRSDPYHCPRSSCCDMPRLWMASRLHQLSLQLASSSLPRQIPRRWSRNITLNLPLNQTWQDRASMVRKDCRPTFSDAFGTLTTKHFFVFASLDRPTDLDQSTDGESDAESLNVITAVQ